MEDPMRGGYWMICCSITIGIKSKHFKSKLLILLFKVTQAKILNKDRIWLDIESLERPVFNESDAVELQLGLTLQQIIDVVNKQYYLDCSFSYSNPKVFSV